MVRVCKNCVRSSVSVEMQKWKTVLIHILLLCALLVPRSATLRFVWLIFFSYFLVGSTILSSRLRLHHFSSFFSQLKLTDIILTLIKCNFISQFSTCFLFIHLYMLLLLKYTPVCRFSHGPLGLARFVWNDRFMY